MAKGRLNGSKLRAMRNAAIERAKDQFREAHTRLVEHATTAAEMSAYRKGA